MPRRPPSRGNNLRSPPRNATRRRRTRTPERTHLQTDQNEHGSHESNYSSNRYRSPEPSRQSETDAIQQDNSDIENIFNQWNEILDNFLKFIICNNCNEVVFDVKCSKCEKCPQKWGRNNDCLPTPLPQIFKNFPLQAQSCIRIVIIESFNLFTH